MAKPKESLGSSVTETTKSKELVNSCPSQAPSEWFHTSSPAISIGFIGAGATARALALGFSLQGWPVVAVSSRSGRSARELASTLKGCSACKTNQEVADAAKLVFIATPDNEIASVASSIHWYPGQWVVHYSGAHSIDLLEPAKRAGCAVASLHPLQSFSGKDSCSNLSGVTFAIEAEGNLLETLKAMVLSLEARFVVLSPPDKALYHLSAVLASNYLVTLVDLATQLWQELGFSREESLTALLPLVQGTVNNLGQNGLPYALTGPISRGDTNTVKKHLEALCEKRPGLLALYCELAINTLPLAKEKGTLSLEDIATMKETIAEYYKGDGCDKGSEKQNP